MYDTLLQNQPSVLSKLLSCCPRRSIFYLSLFLLIFGKMVLKNWILHFAVMAEKLASHYVQNQHFTLQCAMYSIAISSFLIFSFDHFLLLPLHLSFIFSSLFVFCSFLFSSFSFPFSHFFPFSSFSDPLCTADTTVELIVQMWETCLYFKSTRCLLNMLTFFKNKMVFLTFVSVCVYYECNGIMNTAEYGRFLKSAERR